MNTETRNPIRKRTKFAAAVGVAALGVVALGACSSNTSAPASVDASSSSDRQASNNYKFEFSITNNMAFPVTTKVGAVDSFDWEGTDRPDHAHPEGLQNLTLQPHQEARVMLAPNPRANGNPFTLTVNAVASPQAKAQTLVTVPLDAYYNANDALQGWSLRGGGTSPYDKAFSYVDAQGKKSPSTAGFFNLETHNGNTFVTIDPTTAK